MSQSADKQEPHRVEGDPKIIPPQFHIHAAGHHWVERIDFDGRPSGMIVLQWQPIARRWCLPDQYARGADYNVTDYRYLSPCAMPLSDHQKEELRQTIKSLDQKVKAAKGGPVELSVEAWEFMRDLLYPLY